MMRSNLWLGVPVLLALGGCGRSGDLPGCVANDVAVEHGPELDATLGHGEFQLVHLELADQVAVAITDMHWTSDWEFIACVAGNESSPAQGFALHERDAIGTFALGDMVTYEVSVRAKAWTDEIGQVAVAQWTGSLFELQLDPWLSEIGTDYLALVGDSAVEPLRMSAVAGSQLDGEESFGRLTLDIQGEDGLYMTAFDDVDSL